LVKESCSLDNFALADRRAASATLLLLIASILLTRPNEFSGLIGWVASSNGIIAALILTISSFIFFLNAFLSSLKQT
jgi:hypothetical protein